ncbi:L-idonate 5-dehydrogenase [bacteria symbiont BFo1 of Frankliniella occidentalis]|jgi:L-idonate 5-dehydrogenase|uniref:L-idonate 5-dehydrogenase n=1 Tax=Erwinia aphidicola TaxID=68334 RepID=UPI00066464A9|nr:L-idonate 5-dehydrogenase [Erwinia aphidicola]KMV68063.1 L-idonate 5-dehydrogenase [bacteria symbiont BFo1 of Frankliniella occidentalis]KYP82699.1 L-idonate 5-dehydrogenase [bacteria symbiont BFo1 of Frankliniella occidentalis]KYP87528.1 L-idonate 5-dehydrogenase [bacteria symbiont BFo1 of Frankliniella occidentalis]MBD1374794.1 alcohol dehydrogenase catalytic domain-containing protein [Erwinia aphidicola]MBD1377347.1 alcohol dehydrogenase catalytic domain-containing protein [Erwinia aphid
MQHIKEIVASVVSGAHQVSNETRSLTWSDSQVLVKVERGGICGSDLHYYQHGRAGMSILKQPLILGHEFVGRIEQAPPESGLRAGQRVAVNPSQPCNQCELCLKGKQNLCRTMKFMGSAQFFPHINGGFASFVAVSPAQCVPFAEDVDSKIIAFAEPLAVALHAIHQAGEIFGKKVLVTGSGPIGCLVIAAALAGGAAEIVATDMSPRCRQLALEMGATQAIDPSDESLTAHWLEDGGYFDLCFEASGAAAAIASTVGFTRPAGRIVQLGMGAAALEFPLGPLLVKEIVLAGSFRFISEFQLAVRWLESGRINPLPLLSAEFPQQAIVAALEMASDKSRAAKVQVVFG